MRRIFKRKKEEGKNELSLRFYRDVSPSNRVSRRILIYFPRAELRNLCIPEYEVNNYVAIYIYTVARFDSFIRRRRSPQDLETAATRNIVAVNTVAVNIHTETDDGSVPRQMPWNTLDPYIHDNESTRLLLDAEAPSPVKDDTALSRRGPRYTSPEPRDAR